MSGAWGFKGLKNRALEFPAGDNVELAPSGRARLRYNKASNKLQQSLSGGGYVDIGGGAGSGGWTDDGGVVRLTTAADTVAIGAAMMVGSEKLLVVGDVLIDAGGKLNWDYQVGERQIFPLTAPVDTAGTPLASFGGSGGDASAGPGGAGGYHNFSGGFGGAGTGALAAGAGGRISVSGGDGGTPNAGPGAAGGLAEFAGGAASGDGAGGGVSVTGGAGSGSGGGGTVIIDAGSGAPGGNINIGAVAAVEVSIGAPAHGVDVTINIVDNDPAFVIKEGANEYLNIDTTTGAEVMGFGNTTDNPNYTFLGTGLATIAGDVAVGAVAMAGSEKFRVVGDCSFSDDLFFETEDGGTHYVQCNQSTAGVNIAGDRLYMYAGRSGDSTAQTGTGGVLRSYAGAGGVNTGATHNAGQGGTALFFGGDGGRHDGAAASPIRGGSGGGATFGGGDGGRSGATNAADAGGGGFALAIGGGGGDVPAGGTGDAGDGADLKLLGGVAGLVFGGGGGADGDAGHAYLRGGDNLSGTGSHGNVYVGDSHTTEINIGAGGNKIGHFGVAAVVQPTALTVALTQISHSGPGAPDYAIGTPIDSGVGSAWGFATQDEFETLMSVVLNLQTRVDELETKLQSLGLLEIIPA